MVLTISDEEYFRMKATLLDKDRDDALELMRIFVKRLEQQASQGLRSHLDGA